MLEKVTEKITRLGELEDTLTEKEASESALRGQFRRDSETHAAELQCLRRERDASKQQLRQEQLQNEARINSAIAYLSVPSSTGAVGTTSRGSAYLTDYLRHCMVGGKVSSSGHQVSAQRTGAYREPRSMEY